MTKTHLMQKPWFRALFNMAFILLIILLLNTIWNFVDIGNISTPMLYITIVICSILFLLAAFVTPVKKKNEEL